MTESIKEVSKQIDKLINEIDEFLAQKKEYFFELLSQIDGVEKEKFEEILNKLYGDKK